MQRHCVERGSVSDETIYRFNQGDCLAETCNNDMVYKIKPPDKLGGTSHQH